MTEDDVTRGVTQVNILNGAPFEPVSPPINIESVIATLPTGQGGAQELWKLNHYYERLDDWYAGQGIAPNPFLPAAAEPEWELHNLTVDPEERHNRAFDDRCGPVEHEVSARNGAGRKATDPEAAKRHPIVIPWGLPPRYPIR